MDVELAVAGPDNLDSDTRDWMFNLLSGNMRKLYEDCTWGWKDSGKKEELFDSRAKYLVAKDVSQGGDPRLVAFAHFRFDMDYDDEVVYVYEIQLEDSVRRKGLGKFMMQARDRIRDTLIIFMEIFGKKGFIDVCAVSGAGSDGLQVRHAQNHADRLQAQQERRRVLQGGPRVRVGRNEPRRRCLRAV